MSDNWGRERVEPSWRQERVEPMAVGPPRRRRTRADRMREARGRRKRRMASGLALGILVVVVIGVVFLGSKLWHNVFGTGSDFTGDGVSDVVIQVHDGDSTTAIGQTLQDQNVVADLRRIRRRRAGKCRHLGDPARLLQGAHRNPGGECR